MIPEFSKTGISLIDSQHEQYAALIEKLFAACERTDVDKAELDDACREVVAYAVEHFDAEEALMLSLNYKGYETHRTKHDEFREESDRLLAMQAEASDDESHQELLVQLTRLLTEWFCEQVLVHDQALATHLKKK